MSKTLSLPREKALVEYEAATPEQKELLEKLFGKESLQKDIIDRVKSFEDVIAITGVRPEDYKFPASDNRDVCAGQFLSMWLLIVYCFNGNQDADWSDSGQVKYFPYNSFSPGSGWSYFDCDYWYAHSGVGARQAFLNPEHPKHCVELFKEIYFGYFS